jgi:hypothetical protein
MIKKYYALNFLLCLFILVSCGKPLPTIEGIELDAWEQDKDACNGKRASTISLLREQKNKLLGLDEMNVVKLLGKPDENELYKRNEKFFHYFLEPSEKCNPGGKKAPLRLNIRFNAMGLAKEVLVY